MNSTKCLHRRLKFRLNLYAGSRLLMRSRFTQEPEKGRGGEELPRRSTPPFRLEEVCGARRGAARFSFSAKNEIQRENGQ
jgi:hypothetical protein